jgi:Fe-S-cluster containining protein
MTGELTFTGSRELVQIGEVAQMQLCAICPEPGHCCRRFFLNWAGGEELTFWKDGWKAAALEAMHSLGLPFEPFEIRQTFTTDDGIEYVTVHFNCPKVTAEGRCSIYESRPETCRRYRPGSDGLCVFSRLMGHSG